MYQGLQKNAGSDRADGTAVRPVEIILDNNYAQKVKAFIFDAQREVRICAYAWRWYDSEPELALQQFNIELLRAARSGIQVRVLVDTEIMAQRFRSLGFNVRAVQPTRMLHTKAVVIDDKTLVIGSHNLTKRANTDNYEISVAIQDYESVAQFINYFDRLWASRG